MGRASLNVVLGVLLPAILFLGLPAAAEPAIRGVSLDTPTITNVWPKDDPEGIGESANIVGLELIRQAVLIAARDELGLKTSDDSLYEPAERKGYLRLSIGLKQVPNDGSYIEFRRGDELIEKVFIKTKWGDSIEIPGCYGSSEKFSRTQAVQILRKVGLEGKPNAWHNSAPVPEAILEQVDQMGLVPQFLAARALHELIREEGESPERLWALVRAYTNLSQECRWHIQCHYAVFQARAMLYAQRLKSQLDQRKQSHNSIGLTARTFAYTVFGYPRWAEGGIKELEKRLAAHEGPAPEWAPWVRLCRALFDHDYEALDGLIEAGGPPGTFAALWGVVLYEFVDLKKLKFDAIGRAMELDTMSVRALHGGYHSLGVSAGHWLTEAAPQVFAAEAGRALAKIEGAPPGVMAMLEPLDGRPMSLRQLAELGWALEDLDAQGGDDAELGFGVLGSLIGETNAPHIMQRAKFMRRMWGVDTTDYFRQNAFALQRHPFRPIILTFLFPKRHEGDGMRQLMAAFEPRYVNHYFAGAFSFHMPNDFTFADGQTNNDWRKVAFNTHGFASNDWAIAIDGVNAMAGVDKHHPWRIAKKIRLYELNDQEVQDLAQTYGEHPLVSAAVADYMVKQGDLEAARGYAKLAADGAPERKTVERQAKIELLMGHEGRWLALMESILKLPDYSLDHAKINEIVAKTLMNMGRYEDALPYAEAAADSWAWWAMKTYVVCLTGLERYGQAEAVTRAMDERYGGSNRFNWGCWSLQVDKDELFKTYSVINLRTGRDESLLSIGTVNDLVSLMRFEEAFDHLETRLRDPEKQMTSRHLLQGVCLAQHLNKPDRRDDYLDRLINYPPDNGKRLRFALLGDLFKQALADGEVDLEQAKAWADANDGDDHQNWKEYGLWFMATMGDQRGRDRLIELSRTEAMGPNVAAKYRAIARALGASEQDIRPNRLIGAHTIGPVEPAP